MKQILLIILLLMTLIGATLQDQVVLIQIVIPENWLPYYEWLKSFPGHLPPLPNAPQEIKPDYQTNGYRTHCSSISTYSKDINGGKK